MEWVYPRRRGPEWKQGWTGQTMASISAPPIPLLTIFGIVILLLWFSQSANYQAQLHQSSLNLQLFIILLPILIILFMISFSSSGRFVFWQQRLEQEIVRRSGAGGFPWGIAILVGVVLVLLSYQSSFHSKWFGGRSN
ncbi:hypothetical protein COLO4_17253 [Corchorus olitorius]|uniref:Transmembrane protein n=1 Tax=Corchorus olitorius TaxID=93759 RepID=A0A1R3JDK6_9ROSI|nr:hypothetical protein COLO4_17253 [Corchorus olitorius]